ncbi:MAG: hypothetical protein ACJARE_002113 [Paracoccaceae bacterium]|jgi:hypothetical protein
MRKTLIAASVLALVAGSASAATVSYNTTSGNTGLTSVSAAGSPYQVLFKQFNTTLGTLTGIDISIGGNTVTKASFTNTGGVTGTINSASLDTTVTFQRADASIASNAFLGGLDVTFFLATGFPPAGDSVGAGATRFYPGPTGADTTSQSGPFTDTLGSGAFGDYEGTGTVAWDLFISGLLNTSKSTNTTWSEALDATYSLDPTITYTYTAVAAVPVPTALPLLATAFGALGLLRLRRKA